MTEARITSEAYHADPCPVPSLSRGVIMDLLYRSPRHAWFNHPRLNPDYEPEKPEEKFDLGTAAHSLFLQGIDIAEVIEAKDWRTKAAQEARDAARQAGKIPLLADQYSRAVDMVNVAREAFRKHNAPFYDMPDGDSEVAFLLDEDGTWSRVLVDWVSKDRGTLWDYKTTGQSANPEDFTRSIIANGYDIQDAFYRRTVGKKCGTRPTFTFMVQETYPPYLCSFIELDLQFQDMGESKVRKGIEIWKRCMSTGEWPGYSDRIYTVEAPAWGLTSWEYRKVALEVEREMRG